MRHCRGQDNREHRAGHSPSALHVRCHRGTALQGLVTRKNNFEENNYIFQGKFWMCSDRAQLDEASCQGTFFVYNEGLIDGQMVVERRFWTRNEFNYDNVLKAMLTLFVVATFEGWPG